MDWDTYFLNMAHFVAKKSKDPSTKCGTVIVSPIDHSVLAIGYNGLPRGARDDVPERNERPTKYLWYEHSERNALYNAARRGVCLEGSTAYVSFFPCMDCARGLWQSGVVRVVNANVDTDPEKHQRWLESRQNTIELFEEVGMEVCILEGFKLDV